jgi:hypothetical protein
MTLPKKVKKKKETHTEYHERKCLEFNLESLSDFNKGKKAKEKKSSKISLKILKNIARGKTILDQIKNIKEEDINPKMFDIGKCKFYKGDAIDIRTMRIYEFKMLTAVFLTDPYAIKHDDTIAYMKKIGLSVQEYNLKIRLINERCGDFICKLISDAFKINDVVILTDNGIHKIDEDVVLKSKIGPDRNTKKHGLIRWYITYE